MSSLSCHLDTFAVGRLPCSYYNLQLAGVFRPILGVSWFPLVLSLAYSAGSLIDHHDHYELSSFAMSRRILFRARGRVNAGPPLARYVWLEMDHAAHL